MCLYLAAEQSKLYILELLFIFCYIYEWWIELSFWNCDQQRPTTAEVKENFPTLLLQAIGDKIATTNFQTMISGWMKYTKSQRPTSWF